MRWKVTGWLQTFLGENLCGTDHGCIGDLWMATQMQSVQSVGWLMGLILDIHHGPWQIIAPIAIFLIWYNMSFHMQDAHENPCSISQLNQPLRAWPSDPSHIQFRWLVRQFPVVVAPEAPINTEWYVLAPGMETEAVCTHGHYISWRSNLFLYMVRIHASSILYTHMCAYLVKLSQRCRMVYWIQSYHTYHFSNAFIVSAISAGSKSHFSDGWLYVDTDQDHFTAFPKNYISAPNLEYAGSCTLHHEHGGIINCPFLTRWHLR